MGLLARPSDSESMGSPQVFLGNNEDVSVQNVLLALDDLRLAVVSGGCEEQEGFFWGRYVVEV